MKSTPNNLRGLSKLAQSMTPELRLIFRTYTDNWADTHDLLQDLWLRILRSKGCDPITARERIRQLAHELGGKWHYGNQRVLANQTRLALLYGRNDSITDTPESVLDAERRQEALRQVIADFPDRCRQAWILVKLQGCTRKEAAREMNVSPATIGTYMRDGMKACRKRLMERGGGYEI